jgi:hypothetical protein
MTEYYENEMNVYGNSEDLAKFRSDVAEDEENVLNFNKIIPMPEDVSAWDDDRDGTGWYYWQIENWGVKWGARYTFVDDMGKHLAYLFDCPWGAPEPVFIAAVKKYPSLSFDIITYDWADHLLLEMKSIKGKLKKFCCYGYYHIEVENGILEVACREYDYIKNTTEKLDYIPIRVFADNKSKIYNISYADYKESGRYI